MNIDLRSLGLFTASLAPLLAVVLFDDAIRNVTGEAAWLILLGIAAVCFFAFSHHYIQRLDEAAWQAQKHAWFWGGSIGLVVGLFLFLAPTPISDFIRIQLDAAVRHGAGDGPFTPVDKAFLLGVTYIVMAQAAGFLVGWVFWWARRA